MLYPYRVCHVSNVVSLTLDSLLKNQLGELKLCAVLHTAVRLRIATTLVTRYPAVHSLTPGDWHIPIEPAKVVRCTAAR